MYSETEPLEEGFKGEAAVAHQKQGKNNHDCKSHPHPWLHPSLAPVPKRQRHRFRPTLLYKLRSLMRPLHSCCSCFLRSFSLIRSRSISRNFQAWIWSRFLFILICNNIWSVCHLLSFLLLSPLFSFLHRIVRLT